MGMKNLKSLAEAAEGIKAISDVATEGYKTYAGVQQEKVHRNGNVVETALKEYGECKRTEKHTLVEREKNQQTYDIQKLGLILNNLIDVGNCIVNGAKVISDGNMEGKRIENEREKIENTRQLQSQNHKEKMEELNKNFLIEYAKLENEQECYRMSRDDRRTVLLQLEEMRRQSSEIFEKIKNCNSPEERASCLEVHKSISNNILALQKLLNQG